MLLIVQRSNHLRFWIAICVVIGGFGVLLYFAASRPHVQSMQYDQFLAILLTALGVVLTALALVVGLVAIFGYQKISEIAADEARKSAVGYLEQFLGGTVDEPRRRRTASKKKVVSRAKRSVIPSASDMTSAGPVDKKIVARRYPKKEDYDNDQP